VKLLLQYLIGENGPCNAYVRFSPGDEIAVCVNNFGGMSILEMGALTDEVLIQLPPYLQAVRVYTGTFLASLNAPAFSITLVNLTRAAATASVHITELLSYLDAQTDTAWPCSGGQHTQFRTREEQIVASKIVERPKVQPGKQVKRTSA
jgi:dihydroxyacetone kinase